VQRPDAGAAALPPSSSLVLAALARHDHDVHPLPGHRPPAAADPDLGAVDRGRVEVVGGDAVLFHDREPDVRLVGRRHARPAVDQRFRDRVERGGVGRRHAERGPRDLVARPPGLEAQHLEGAAAGDHEVEQVAHQPGVEQVAFDLQRPCHRGDPLSRVIIRPAGRRRSPEKDIARMDRRRCSGIWKLSVALILTGAVPVLAAVLGPAPGAAAAQAPPPAAAGGAPVATPQQVAFFETQVRPILQAQCVLCHGGENPSGGLALTGRDALLKGGASGPAVSLAKPADSLLLRAVHYDGRKMPPQGKLPRTQIEILERWVRMGLPWTPKAPGTEASPEPHHGPPPVNAETRNFWSFRPVHRPAVPKVKNTGWVTGPIDAFVLARLEAAGLAPAPPASKTALLRRVFYDLIGLPPTPADVKAFLDDPSPRAYEKVVDRLLASPQYGERWGRHWLDLVRYAETNSFERDDPKPFAWRYRDYVIAAFNRDKPYDRFLREQLAGDELPRVTPETLVATGFYRLGQWDDEPSDPEQARFDELDDLVGTTAQAMLGLTVNCARCHDHKLDPIPQKDYYRLLAFFRGRHPLRRPERRVGDAGVAAADLAAGRGRALRGRVHGVPEEAGRDRGADQNDRGRRPRGLRAGRGRGVQGRGEAGRPAPQARPEAAEFGAVRALRRTGEGAGRAAQGAAARAGTGAVRYRKRADPAADVRAAPGQPAGARRGGRARLPVGAQPAAPAAAGAAAGRRVVAAAPGPGRLDHEPEEPAHGPRHGEPRVAVPLRPGHRPLAQQLRAPGHAADAPRAAGLAGGRTGARRLAAQAAAPDDPAVERVPDVVAGEPEGARPRPGERPVLALRHAAPRRRGGARLAAGSFRDAEPAARRAEHLPGDPEGGAGGPVAAGPRLAHVAAGGTGAPQRVRHVKRSLTVPILASFDAADTDASCPVRFATTQPTQALGLLNSAFVNEQARRFAASLRRRPGRSRPRRSASRCGGCCSVRRRPPRSSGASP
jgi:hypothetical protein